MTTLPSISDAQVTMATIASRKSFADVQRVPSYSPALPGIAELLGKMVAKGDAKGRGSDRTAFDGSKPAPVSIQDYLIRMCKYGFCSREVFVCMVIYLGRIRARAGTTFTSYNIHRLLLTSFVVAAKLRDDTYYSNKYYASIGGVTLPDMNKMEQCFLKCTGWELHISKKEYDQYYSAMTASSSSSTTAAASAVPAVAPVPKVSASPAHVAHPPQKGTKPAQRSLRSILSRASGAADSAAEADSCAAGAAAGAPGGKLARHSAPRGSIALRDVKPSHCLAERHDTERIAEPIIQQSSFVSC